MARREVPAFGDWVLESGKKLNSQIEHSLGEFVRKCMKLLEPLDRELLTLYYVERKTYHQIGEMLSILWNKDFDRRHAFYYVKRARERLREIMQQESTTLNESLRDRFERIAS